MGWYTFAIIAMLSSTIIFLLIKKLTTLNLEAWVIYTYTGMFSLMIALSYVFTNKISLNVSSTALILLAIIGLFAALGNTMMIKSVATAPNPGYSLAIAAAHVFLVAILSIFLFKSQITLAKGVGLLLTVIGVILLGL